MTAVAEFQAAELGYVGLQMETTPGTKPESYEPDILLWETNGLDSTQINVRKKMAGNSRNSQRGVYVTFFDNGGELGFPMYPNSGAVLGCALLGQDTLTTEVNTTASGTVTTAVGLSNIPITGATTDFEVGAWVLVGSGADTEARQIYSVDTDNITVGALDINAAATSGTVVLQPVQHHFSEIQDAITGPPALDKGNLPTLWVENNLGGRAKSENYPGTQVGQLDLSLSTGIMEAKYMLHSNFPRKADTATEFSATMEDLIDAISPFTAGTMQAMAYCDPAATGTGSIQLFTDWQKIEVMVSNNMITKDLAANSVRQHYPTTRSATAKMGYLDRTLRSVEFDDILGSINNTANVFQPFLAGAAINQGTQDSPEWAASGIRIAAARYYLQKRTATLGDILAMDVELEAVPHPDGSPLLDMYVLNQVAASYTLGS